jgi:hypothetical protein
MCSSTTTLAAFVAVVGTNIIMLIITPNHEQTVAQPADANNEHKNTPKMICPYVDELIEMSPENRFLIRLYFKNLLFFTKMNF